MSANHPTPGKDDQLDEILLPLKIYADSELRAVDPEKCIAKVKAAILANFTPNTEIEAALGEEEPTFGAQNEAGHVALEDYEASARNNLRYQIRQRLNLNPKWGWPR